MIFEMKIHVTKLYHNIPSKYEIKMYYLMLLLVAYKCVCKYEQPYIYYIKISILYFVCIVYVFETNPYHVCIIYCIFSNFANIVTNYWLTVQGMIIYF